MSKLYLLFVIFILCVACATNNDFNKVKLVYVYDGDTFKVNLPCKKEIFCQNILVRIKGIDTAEISTKNVLQKDKALKAKEFSEEILTSGKILLKNCTRDKYFRLLCDVFIIKNNFKYNLSEELLKQNLALKYNGKNKSDIDTIF